MPPCPGGRAGTRDRQIARAGPGTQPTGSTGLPGRGQASKTRRTPDRTSTGAGPARPVSARTATVPAAITATPELRPWQRRAGIPAPGPAMRGSSGATRGSRMATPASARPAGISTSRRLVSRARGRRACKARRVHGIRPGGRVGRPATAALPADTSLNPASARRRDSPHRPGRVSNQGLFHRGGSASSRAPLPSRGTARTGSDRPSAIRPAASGRRAGMRRLSNPASARPVTRRTAATTNGTITRRAGRPPGRRAVPANGTAPRPARTGPGSRTASPHRVVPHRHPVRGPRTASHPRTGSARRARDHHRAGTRDSLEGSRRHRAGFPADSRCRTSSRRLDSSSRGSSSTEHSSSRERRRRPHRIDRASTSATTSASAPGGRGGRAAPAPPCAAASPTRGPGSGR